MSVEELLDNYRGGGDGVSMPGAAIAEIMRQHRSDAEVQAAGCEALDQKTSDEALGIGAAAAVSLAVAALRTYPGDDYVQFYGIRLLGQIACHFRTEQAAVVNAGAVPLIMTALRGHADDADVQCIGFKAVARLLDISEDDDDNWVDVPVSPDSRVQLPAYRAIVAAGAAPLGRAAAH